MLDLGTGSGALAVSFLYYCKEARGVAVDISEEALETAKTNGERAGISDRVEFRRGDFLDALREDEQFDVIDVILSNPPYIPSGDIDGLAEEVRREPRIALDGGADGLKFYRALGEKAARFLRPGGLLAAEVGIGQAETVRAFFENGGLTDIESRITAALIGRSAENVRTIGRNKAGFYCKKAYDENRNHFRRQGGF